MDMINEIGRWLQEKEVLPTALERLGMADKLAEIVLISLGITVLLGILSCFFGLKLARFWSFLTVFVIGTGAAAAVAMQITSDETLSGIIGLAAGIILAIVFAILKRAGMFVTAFVLGAALSIYWLRPANLIWLLVCVGIGLVFALLTIKLFVPVLMLLTGVTGAVCISQAGTVLLGHAGVELERWMVTLAFAVLAVLGILVQFLMESGKRQKLHLKKAAEIREQNSTEKEVHTAAVPHAEELEMEFEDEFEDDDEDEEDEEVMKEDLIVSEEIVTEDEYLDKDLDEDFDEDLDEFWDDEDDDVEIVEIDLSDQDDEDK